MAELIIILLLQPEYFGCQFIACPSTDTGTTITQSHTAGHPCGLAPQILDKGTCT